MIEAEGFEMQAYTDILQSFKLGGGTGSLVYVQLGWIEIALSKFNDKIFLSKNNLQINNLILGSPSMELIGDIKGLNQTTGDKIEVKFNPKSWGSDSYISGSVCDKNGKVIYTLSGNTHTEMFLNEPNGTKHLIWKMPEPLGPEAARQYNFSPLVINLNYLSEEMKQSGYLAPTDSRFRGD